MIYNLQIHVARHSTSSSYSNILQYIYRPRSRSNNTFGSVRVSVRLSVDALLFEPFDLWPWFWHEGRHWPWLAWDCRSRSLAKAQGQTVKIVYAPPFEPVVRSRSILGRGLPSSASGNCEWQLLVHWNCLFVSNQGAFNVSRISGRSALIIFKLHSTFLIFL